MAKKPKEIFLNPAVPPELKELVEQATGALRAHTAEGRAIVLTELRKRLDEGVKELRDKGYDTAIPDENVMKKMAEAVGKEDAQAVFGSIYNKAFYEGYIYKYAGFAKFKDDVLIANEK